MKKNNISTCPKCKGKTTTQLMNMGGANFLELSVCPTCKTKKIKTSFYAHEVCNMDNKK
jgi:predicted Zn-ribbon and HTH transcriptional regulator